MSQRSRCCTPVSSETQPGVGTGVQAAQPEVSRDSRQVSGQASSCRETPNARLTGEAFFCQKKGGKNVLLSSNSVNILRVEEVTP